MTCGARATHRPSPPCAHEAGHPGHHSWDERRILWTGERIIERLREWERPYGYAPRQDDWHPGCDQVDWRWECGTWPTSLPVTQRFGSWATALTAAGVVERPRWGASSPVERTCGWCGERFTRRPGEPACGYARRKACSRSCGGSLSKRAEFGERMDAVARLVAEGRSNSEIALALGVHYQAVGNLISRMRRRGYEIPTYRTYAKRAA